MIEIGGQLVRDPLQAALGVAHRRRVVAVARPEVALAVDQRIAEAEVLGLAYERVVRSRVAVRMVFAHHVADDTGGLAVGPVPMVAVLVHREEDASMHRLQPVAHIG